MVKSNKGGCEVTLIYFYTYLMFYILPSFHFSIILLTFGGAKIIKVYGNVGDWLYIVFLIIAAVSGLFSSKDKKKKSRPDILGQPDREIVPNDQPTEGKGFWEILEDMQKETQKPKPAPRQKQVKSKVEKPQVVTSSPASSPFLSAEKNIPNHIAPSHP